MLKKHGEETAPDGCYKKQNDRYFRAYLKIRLRMDL